MALVRGVIMRFFLFIVILAIGWIIGSLYPAPEIMIAPIKERIAAVGTDKIEEPETSNVESSSSSSTEATPGGPVSEETLDRYRTWIVEARKKHPYPESADRMLSVMMCESRGQATIINPAGPYKGLFQYNPQTWNGDWNEYRDEDILDPRAQIFATALAWQRGMQGQWGCYNRDH
jgi:hypothetical protein